MKNIIYDTGFNLNEWLVIGFIVVGFAVVLLLPKIFSSAAALFCLMFGVTTGLMFDHTIAVPPFDYYDVGDLSDYQYFDIFSYLMYAPFGYIFIFLYLKLNVTGFKIVFYIILWTAIGIGIEWVSKEAGIFHYKHGYRLLYSIPIYLFVQSIQLVIFQTLFQKRTTTL
ncbi:hypothetical protein ACWM35_20915 [Neobacillus sp. K501]